MEDGVAQESPEYADWIDRLEHDPGGRYLWLGTNRVSFTQAAVHDYGLPEDADAHEFWEAAFSASFGALARHTLGDISDIDRPDRLFLGYAQLGRPFATLLPDHTSTTSAGPTVAATLFLQAALDNGFAKKGIGRLPLGWQEHDSPSAEAKKLSVSDKLANIRNILDSGVTLLDAVLVYRAYYTREKRKDVARQLPEDLATPAGVASRSIECSGAKAQRGYPRIR